MQCFIASELHLILLISFFCQTDIFMYAFNREYTLNLYINPSRGVLELDGKTYFVLKG